ncbi:MAG: acyltransferase family protein [Treponema succinifaciens]|nr:MAG: acyltransferase family protein [Treponema succinifaciens]
MNEVIVVKNKERTPLYDVAKGICIISVVLGHLGIATRFVYFYHLPVFFFISGLFLNAEKYSFKDFLLKKIKSLYVPYVIISLLFAIIFDFQKYEKNIKYVLRIFLFDSKAPFTGTFFGLFLVCL